VFIDVMMMQPPPHYYAPYHGMLPMSPRTCLACRRLNPPLAAYCYFDGAPLAAGTVGPQNVGSQHFPTPFVLPSGRSCRSFAELAHACRQDWAAARGLMGERSLRPFLAYLGRNDLALAAACAAAHPDPDQGLDDFLAQLPGCQPSPPALEVGGDDIDLGTMAAGQDQNFLLTIRNVGERLLTGLIRTENCLWLWVDGPGLQEKRFKAAAHEQLHFALHVRGDQLRARPQPQVGEIVVESNGGAQRVVVRIHVPVTPFPHGVAQGAQTPRQFAEKAGTALQETTRLLEDGSVARWYQSNGWTYPVLGPAATGVAAAQQYFEALGLSAPPRVELRSTAVTLRGAAGGMASGQLVLATAENRPVYAQARADQPWLSVGPAESRGTEAVIPLTVANVPACPGQTLYAQLWVRANGKQLFKVPVSLLVEPAALTEVQQGRDTEHFSRPLTGAQTPPPPNPVPEQPTETPIPPPDAEAGSGWRQIWGVLVAASLVLGVLAGAAVVNRVVDRDGGSDPTKTPPVQTPTTLPVAPTTAKPTPPPATEKTRDREPEGSFVKEVIRKLNDSDLVANREALADLEVNLTKPGIRRAIPALLGAAGRQTDEDFRDRAAKVVRALGPPRKEDAGCLKGALAVRHPAIRRYVFFALKEMGDRSRAAMAVVAEALKHPESAVRREALGVVRTLGGTARALAFQALLNPADDAEVQAVRGALTALLKLGPLTAEEIDVPTEVLADSARRSWVRCLAADLLGEAGKQAAGSVPVLVAVLQEKNDAAVMVRSIRALRQIGDRRAEVLTALVNAATSHSEERIRLEAVGALKQLDPSALSTAQVLELWGAENAASVRTALLELLEARLATLEAGQMSELLPLLRHNDPEIVQMGLNVVRDRKAAAAAVTAEVMDLLARDEARMREAALAALQALSPAVRKQLPRLFEALKKRPKEQRAALGLAVFGLIDANDARSLQSLVPFLLDGLHPASVRAPGAKTEKEITEVLIKIGQPAVDGIFQNLETLLAVEKQARLDFKDVDTDNNSCRKNLYDALATLGPSCKSPGNFNRIRELRKKEPTVKSPNGRETRFLHEEVDKASWKALNAMDAR
jgi:hypothetical protein